MSETGSDIRVCQRCGIRYSWRRSSSSWLKMTYCGFMCEIAANGCTIDELLKRERSATKEDQKSSA